MKNQNQKKQAIDKFVKDCLKIFPETVEEVDAYELKNGTTQLYNDKIPDSSFIFKSNFWSEKLKQTQKPPFAMAARFGNDEDRKSQEEIIIELINEFEKNNLNG